MPPRPPECDQFRRQKLDRPDPGDLGQLWKAAIRRAEAKLGRISPKTLSARLKEVEAAIFIRREILAEMPPRVEHSLTPEDKDLVEAVQPLIRWADRIAHDLRE